MFKLYIFFMIKENNIDLNHFASSLKHVNNIDENCQQTLTVLGEY